MQWISQDSDPSSRLRNNTRFHWSTSIGKARMTPVRFFMIREDCGIIYEVCRLGHRMDRVHLPERIKTGLVTALDQIVRAVHSCNSCCNFSDG